MSQFLDSMIARAKADKKTIVLPEGNDIRTLKAAEAILAEGIADLIVLGDADDITAAGCNLEGARIVDFRTSELREPYAEKLAELRDEYGPLADIIHLALPDEKFRRVGQSAAAASLPENRK